MYHTTLSLLFAHLSSQMPYWGSWASSPSSKLLSHHPKKKLSYHFVWVVFFLRVRAAAAVRPSLWGPYVPVFSYGAVLGSPSPDLSLHVLRVLHTRARTVCYAKILCNRTASLLAAFLLELLVPLLGMLRPATSLCRMSSRFRVRFVRLGSEGSNAASLRLANSGDVMSPSSFACFKFCNFLSVGVSIS